MQDPELSASAFSWCTRAGSLGRFAREEFDLLVIGGGITGAGVARDSAMRGLKVALVERGDFASGTSSKSSKLIHGGVRYLENLEFHLVFEALSERANLLKTAPSMVRPLKFFFPVYRGDRLGMFKLSLGLWLYDLLALFRTPGFHRLYFRRGLLRQIPFLRQKGLKGGFSYYDASMWDDVIAVEVLRSARSLGAEVANYAEAVAPLWGEGEHAGRIVGFRVRDLLNPGAREVSVRAKKVVVCAGPWTDELGAKLSEDWKGWLAPSKGVHLIFDLKRIPVPGAMVMSQPQDGRIAFVIPRPDFGAGVVIVGTTDGPSPRDPAHATIDPEDVNYLLGLLARYFPDLQLKASDILSAYVGVRPLMGQSVSAQSATGGETALQKVSREHHIGGGPGGTVIVAGGKYTTFRKMAEEIVDFALKDLSVVTRPSPGKSGTLAPFNRLATPDAVQAAKQKAVLENIRVPAELWERYGADALNIVQLAAEHPAHAGAPADPEGFPFLAAQLRYSIRHEMCIRLSDFYLRRLPLYAARADHGLPWAETLAQVWAEERGLAAEAIAPELASLREKIAQLSSWKKSLAPPAEPLSLSQREDFKAP